MPITTQDIRWIQRLNHFSKALNRLRQFIQKGALNKLEEQGLLHAFEYTFELAWNTLKDYFEAQGETEIYGSQDALRLAFKRGVIEDGETWMDMIKSRTLTCHAYNEDVAEKIAVDILKRYFSEFVTLQTKMESFKQELS
jgi:nucleotidyltransferase substrate binding protein (TIGR01987 family)